MRFTDVEVLDSDKQANKSDQNINCYIVLPIMAVNAVHLESDAFLVCMNHALSTEKEEVMGLCIGEVWISSVVYDVLYRCASTATGVFTKLCNCVNDFSPSGGHKPYSTHSFCHYSASIRQEERQSGDFTRATVSSVHWSRDILSHTKYTYNIYIMPV